MQVMLPNEDFDEDQLQDIACIALNQLPGRYVRSAAIMDFFLTDEQQNQMEIEVVEAIQQAKQFFIEQTNADKVLARLPHNRDS